MHQELLRRRCLLQPSSAPDRPVATRMVPALQPPRPVLVAPCGVGEVFPPPFFVPKNVRDGGTQSISPSPPPWDKHPRCTLHPGAHSRVSTRGPFSQVTCLPNLDNFIVIFLVNLLVIFIIESYTITIQTIARGPATTQLLPQYHRLKHCLSIRPDSILWLRVY